jgi:hypothetical protein
MWKFEKFKLVKKAEQCWIKGLKYLDSARKPNLKK